MYVLMYRSCSPIVQQAGAASLAALTDDML